MVVFHSDTARLARAGYVVCLTLLAGCAAMRESQAPVRPPEEPAASERTALPEVPPGSGATSVTDVPESPERESALESLEGDIQKLASKLASRLAAQKPSVPVQPLRLAIRRVDNGVGRRSRLDLLLEIKLRVHLLDEHLEVLVGDQELDVLLDAAQATRSGLVSHGHRIEPGDLHGAEAVLFGRTTKVGQHLDLTATIYEVPTGKELAGSSARVALDEELARLHRQTVRPAWEIAEGKQADYVEVPELSLHYTLVGWAKDSSGRYRQIEIRENGSTVMTHRDQFKIAFRTDYDGYVYVLMIGSGGDACRLFPHPDIEQSEQVRGARKYEVPLGDRWYELDDRPGTETIYVIASYEPLSEIAAIPPAPGERPRDVEKVDRSQLERTVKGLRTRGLSPGHVLRDRGVERISQQQQSSSLEVVSPEGELLKALLRQASSRTGHGVRQISFEHR